jgi:integrase
VPFCIRHAHQWMSACLWHVHKRKLAWLLRFLEALRPHFESKAPSDWVFLGKTGTVLDYGYFRRATFQPAVEKLKLTNVTTHTLRHTCASLLISLGTPITTVSYILGHASVKMTLDIYGHYYKDDTSFWMSALGDHFALV